MDKVFICNDARKLPDNYRTCVCECMIRSFFIAFHKDIVDLECPNCKTKFHTGGYGSWISRVSNRNKV